MVVITDFILKAFSDEIKNTLDQGAPADFLY